MSINGSCEYLGNPQIYSTSHENEIIVIIILVLDSPFTFTINLIDGLSSKL